MTIEELLKKLRKLIDEASQLNLMMTIDEPIEIQGVQIASEPVPVFTKFEVHATIYAAPEVKAHVSR